MMLDGHGRPVKSLRMSVTARCNFSCEYCHNEGLPEPVTEMSLPEIGRILSIASSAGIKKVKLTGGEPMVRKDILAIVEVAARHMDEVSMTTNGSGLKHMAADLKKAGLSRVNISLDTLDPVDFKRLTGSDSLNDILAGIESSIVSGLSPVKLNIVAARGKPVGAIMRMVEFAWGIGAFPQVIQALGGEEPRDADPVAELENMFEARALYVKERELHRRRIFTLVDADGAARDVEIVRPMHNSKFCSGCTRIRITADGRIKGCLMHNDGLVDILSPIREGADDMLLAALLEKAVKSRAPYWREEEIVHGNDRNR